MSRLRERRANTAQGAAYFLMETAGWVRYVWAQGQLTVRTDSRFYARAIVAVRPEIDVRLSNFTRQHNTLRNIIQTIPERERRPILCWIVGAAYVAETTCTASRGEPDAAFPAGPLRFPVASTASSTTGTRR